MNNKPFQTDSEFAKYVIKSKTKGELADDYGLSLKTLKKQAQRYNIEFPKNNILTPKEVANFVEVLGSPRRLADD